MTLNSTPSSPICAAIPGNKSDKAVYLPMPAFDLYANSVSLSIVMVDAFDFTDMANKLHEITQRQAEDADKIARITAERDDIAQQFSDLNLRYRKLDKKHEFFLQQLRVPQERIETTARVIPFNNKTRKAWRRFFYMFNLKLRNYKDETEEEGKQLDN